MNKGTLFIAPPGARNKKEAIFKEIVSLYPEGDFSSVLYLGPNSFVLRESERQFFSYLKKNRKKSAYIPFQSLTIKRLASNLHETYGRGDIVSDRIRPLILCEILGEKKIGYVYLLSNLLRKIRHYILDKSLSQVKEEIGKQIFEEKTAGRAVKAIETLEMYEDNLSKKGLIDSESMLRESISLIKEYVITETLVIDGFFDPTPLELEIINALIDKADKAYILTEEASELFKYFQTNKRGVAAKKLKSSFGRENTGYYSYHSMEDEVEGIARAAKSLILEGIRPWEIIVSFPVISKHLPMLRRVFKKHGIPISIEEYELSHTSPFTVIEDMLMCIEGDYPRNDFLSVLISPHFPAIPGILKEWAVTYSKRAGIIKGKESWLSIKGALLNSPEERLFRLGESRSVGAETDKERLDKFQKEMKHVIKVFENIKQQKKLSSYIDAVESALNKFGFFDFLTESPYENNISGKITAQFSELRRFAGLYESGHAGFYLRQILKGLKGMDKSRDGVRVVPYELAATLEAKAIFFGGMVEGDFPSRPEIDPILPEKVKKALGMPELESYLNRQKKYFKRLLNISVNEPCFSSPSAEGDKVFLPSPFLDWGKTITPLTLNIFTEEEILIREGSIKYSESAAKIFWEGELTYDKEAYRILRQKIDALSGFLSVTDIEFYRKCPLRFYIEKILCLEVEKPPRFEVEPKLWGRLAHKTMEYLFKDGDIELNAIDKRLFKGLEISLTQFPIGDFWSKVAREIFKRLLPNIKEQERDIRMQGFSPYKVEEKIRAEINNLKLKGKIDRVDFKIQGSRVQGFKGSSERQRTADNGQRNSVILLDYKTGFADRESLQLPLYAGMWQEKYSEYVEKAGFYSLKDGSVDWRPKRLSMEEYIRGALQTAEELVKEMRKAVFLPSPFKAEECRWCYHSPLCKGGE